jgi:hypothetical protein
MKRIVLILSVLLIGQAVVTPDYKLTALAKPNYLRRGEAGKVVISIELSKRAYIKPAPPLIIKCHPVEGVIFPKEIFKSSEMNLPILQKKELSYIDIKEGIEIPFTIEEKAKSGKRELSFELKFLICSESKGICAKAVETVNVEIFVKRRAIKK